MWYKYLVIFLKDENIRIGVKINLITHVCIVGGKKRWTYDILAFIKKYFDKEETEVEMSLPQTYKIRFTFECTKEMLNTCRERMLDQTEFLLVESSKLGRTMR